MMKTKKLAKSKKDTVLSVLLRIEKMIREGKETTAPEITMAVANPGEITVSVPGGLTMKSVVEKCGNVTSKGNPLLWNIGWYKDEKFYTEEKTREMTITFSKELVEESRSKTWNDQEDILTRQGGIRLNAAEILYVLWFHERETGERLLDFRNGNYSYYWTSSRASSGDFVSVGGFDGDGMGVYGGGPWISDSNLGVCLAKKV